jgi:hypothetical protein
MENIFRVSLELDVAKSVDRMIVINEFAIQPRCLVFYVKQIYHCNGRKVILKLNYESVRGHTFRGKFSFDVYILGRMSQDVRIRRHIKHGVQHVDLTGHESSMSETPASDDIELEFAYIPELGSMEYIQVHYDISIEGQ